MAPQQNAPRLALCLIARDEEQLLPACLDSLCGVVDELVVADTGSEDATAEVAARAGATVVRHRWDDDFAAARNAALAAVTAPWVLLLDADERLGPGADEALAAALDGDALDCGLLPLYQATRLDATPEEVLDGRARDSDPVLLPRLFRRTDDLAWEGVVHEHVRAWLGAEGRRVAVVDAPIIHLGGVAGVRVSRGKQERNLRLLRLRVEQSPRDPDARTYLAQELWNAGHLDEARQEVERAWADVLALEEPAACAPVNTSTLRALAAVQALDFAAALDTVARTRDLLGDRQNGHPNLDFLDGLAHENLGAREGDAGARARHLEQASQAYQQALAGHQRYYPDPVLPGATTWSGACRLGAVAVQLGQPELALTAFEAALEWRPADVEAQLGRCEALMELGREAEAMSTLGLMLSDGGPDVWALTARALERQGAFGEARRCRQRALSMLDAGFIAPHRAALLEDEPS